MQSKTLLTNSILMDLTEVSPIVSPENKELNYEEIRKRTHITLKTKVTPATPNIWIDESVCCTIGGIMVVSGQKKAGKSFGMLFIMATALMIECNIEYTLKIRASYTKKKIVYLDTEMLEADSQDFIKKAMDISGLKKEPENIIMHNLSQLSLVERKFFLSNLLENEKDIEYLIIDGVADFFASVNDEEKAREFIDMIFSKKEKGTSVIFAIHEGKDSNGATGHLGQIIERKCTSTIAFFKDRKLGVHTIKCKMVRKGADFQDLKFMFLKPNPLPVLLNSEQLASLAEKTEETKNDEIRKVITQTFATSRSLSKEEVIQGFLNYDNSIDKTNKIESQKSLARKRLKRAIELEFIKEENKVVTITI